MKLAGPAGLHVRFVVGVDTVKPVLTGVFPPEIAGATRPWLYNIATSLSPRIAEAQKHAMRAFSELLETGRATRKPAKKSKPAAKTAARVASATASPATNEAADEPIAMWVDEGLTGEQERFVNEICADPERNGVRAAMRAYPKQKYEAAKVTACQNLGMPKIQKAPHR
jgi:hypothetical protein